MVRLSGVHARTALLPRRTPCAIAVVFLAGPTKMGMMIPSSAASQGPRSEASSHGWTTTVLAGGTSFASEMSLSYLLRGA